MSVPYCSLTYRAVLGEHDEMWKHCRENRANGYDYYIEIAGYTWDMEQVMKDLTEKYPTITFFGVIRYWHTGVLDSWHLQNVIFNHYGVKYYGNQYDCSSQSPDPNMENLKLANGDSLNNCNSYSEYLIGHFLFDTLGMSLDQIAEKIEIPHDVLQRVISEPRDYVSFEHEKIVEQYSDVKKANEEKQFSDIQVHKT